MCKLNETNFHLNSTLAGEFLLVSSKQLSSLDQDNKGISLDIDENQWKFSCKLMTIFAILLHSWGTCYARTSPQLRWASCCCNWRLPSRPLGGFFGRHVGGLVGGLLLVVCCALWIQSPLVSSLRWPQMTPHRTPCRRVPLSPYAPPPPCCTASGERV